MNSIPFAHETWFGPDAFPADWSFVLQALTLTLLGAAVAATLAVRALSHWFPGVDVAWLSRCAPFMPFAVRIHLAVSLIGLLSLGYYLSPAMDLRADATGILLGAVMALAAIGMATGYHARWAAGLLLAAGPLGWRSLASWRCSSASTCSASRCSSCLWAPAAGPPTTSSAARPSPRRRPRPRRCGH